MSSHRKKLRDLEGILRQAHQSRPVITPSAEWIQDTMQRIRNRAPQRVVNWPLIHAQRFAWRFAICTGATSLLALCYLIVTWGGTEQLMLQMAMLDFDTLSFVAFLGGLVS